MTTVPPGGPPARRRVIWLLTPAGLAGGTALVWAANVSGLWWVTTVAGFVSGLLVPGKLRSWVVGTGSGLLGWVLPLAWLATSISLGQAGAAISALMGYGTPAVPTLLTVAVGAGLAACGTWLGRALRAMFTNDIVHD
jgi:hypothetical protein